MIRKLAILSLLLLYLGTSAGFALSLHFCGKEISDIRLNHQEKKSCCKNEENSTDRCCKDKHISVKISDEQHHAQSAKIPAVSCTALFTATYNPFIPEPGSPAKLQARSFRGPPATDPVPLTIKNCNFRI